MNDITIDRFENKPEFTSDLADFDNSKTELHIRADVKNRKLLNELNIEKLWLIGAREKDIIQEKKIRPEQVAEFKVYYHKKFIESWLKETESEFEFNRIWEIREKCITNLAE